MMDKAIEPCPFCAGLTLFATLLPFDGEPPWRWQVLCANCGSRGPTGESIADALEEWDHREQAGYSLGELKEVRMMTDNDLLDLAHRARLVASSIGPQHAFWDLIFDAEAVLRGERSLLPRAAVERELSALVEQHRI